MPPKKKTIKKDTEITTEELEELGIFQDEEENSGHDEKEDWRDYG